MSEVEVVNLSDEPQEWHTRQGTAGPSRSRPLQTSGKRKRAEDGPSGSRPQAMIDLTIEDNDADFPEAEVSIVRVRGFRPQNAPRRVVHVKGLSRGQRQVSSSSTLAQALGQSVGPPAAPPVIIQDTPPSPKGLKCPICLEKMDRMVSTPCGHVFCESCLLAALKTKKQCPKCRKGVREKQVHRIYLES